MPTPEEAAAALLAEAALGELPVDVAYLADEHEALLVEDHANLLSLPVAPDLPAGTRLSGLLIPSTRTIYVDATEAARSAGRRRFTIAHELGHWRMHSDGAEAHARFCRADDVGATAAQLRQAARLEQEANRFAAELLMPAERVREEAERANLNIQLLARLFGVSGQAMQVRLEVLGVLPDYMRR